MTNELTKLIYATVTEIKSIHDYFQILTDKGTINIYGHVNSEIFDSIINCKIIDVKYDTENYLCLDFNNNQSVIISLDSPDNMTKYFSIYLNTGEIIVE